MKTDKQLEITTAENVCHALKLNDFSFDYDDANQCPTCYDADTGETINGKAFYAFILEDVLNYPASTDNLHPIPAAEFRRFLDFAKQNGAAVMN